MRHIISRAPFLVAGLLAILAACSDSQTITSPEDGASTLAHISSTPGDSAGGGSPSVPSAPSTPGDTALTGTPFVPATAINLAVTVGTPVAGSDTLAYAPLANASVTVFSHTLVAAPGSGGDTLTVSESAVATATTDASGKATFAALPAAQYRVEALGGVGSASVTLSPPYAADVAIHLIVRPVGAR